MPSSRHLLFPALLVLCLSSRTSYGNEKKEEAVSRDQMRTELMQFTVKNPIIGVTEVNFERMIGTDFEGSRTYGFLVLMNSLNTPCHICRRAQDEFELLAYSWRYSAEYSDRFFFGVVDYNTDTGLFKQLQVKSAPTFLYFPENGQRPDQLDIMRNGLEAEVISRWLYQRSDVQIKIIRPANYFALTIMLAMIAFYLYRKRNNLFFLYNRTYWAHGALTIVFVMTSGQMWNSIRGAPFWGAVYVHDSTGGQFVFETYMVLLLNAAVAVGMIMMYEALKGEGEGNLRKRQLMAMVGMGLTAVFFSLLLSLFRKKAHGYPYSFLFK